MTPEEKSDALVNLYGEWSDCTRCPLSNPEGRKRKNVIFGEGNPDAHVMIIGDLPQVTDERANRPMANPYLTGMLEELKSSRDEVFITYLVACRATVDSDPAIPRLPSASEIQICSERLNRIIEIVDPFVILVLGDLALKVLCKEKGLGNHVKSPYKDPVYVTTRGLFLPVTRIGYASYDMTYLAAHWDLKPGSIVHKTFELWEKALKVADMQAHLFLNTELERP